MGYLRPYPSFSERAVQANSRTELAGQRLFPGSQGIAYSAYGASRSLPSALLPSESQLSPPTVSAIPSGTQLKSQGP